MISPEIVLTLLTLLLLSLITLAASRSSVLLSVANATCMICSAVLGQALQVWPGLLVSTAGLYSTVAMIGVGVQCLTYGVRAAYKTIGNNLFALALTLGSMFLLDEALMLSPLFDSRIGVAGARLGSCYLVHSFFIYALDRLKAVRSVWKFIAIGLVAQAIDVMVFFPSAFIGSRSLDLIVQYAIGGLFIRTSVVVLSTPFVVLLLWLIRKGWVYARQANSRGEIPA